MEDGSMKTTPLHSFAYSTKITTACQTLCTYLKMNVADDSLVECNISVKNAKRNQ